jgi:hypothetical protein
MLFQNGESTYLYQPDTDTYPYRCISSGFQKIFESQFVQMGLAGKNIAKQAFSQRLE